MAYERVMVGHELPVSLDRFGLASETNRSRFFWDRSRTERNAGGCAAAQRMPLRRRAHSAPLIGQRSSPRRLPRSGKT